MKSLPIKSFTSAAVISLFASLVLLVIMWHLTTPLQSGPLGILIVFILIYIFFSSLFFVLTGVWAGVAARLRNQASTPSRRYYVSSVLGLLPVLYLTLLSMGGASVWGVGLIVLFISLMLFYVLRRTA